MARTRRKSTTTRTRDRASTPEPELHDTPHGGADDASAAGSRAGDAGDAEDADEAGEQPAARRTRRTATRGSTTRRAAGTKRAAAAGTATGRRAAANRERDGDGDDEDREADADDERGDAGQDDAGRRGTRRAEGPRAVRGAGGATATTARDVKREGDVKRAGADAPASAPAEPAAGPSASEEMPDLADASGHAGARADHDASRATGARASDEAGARERAAARDEADARDEAGAREGADARDDDDARDDADASGDSGAAAASATTYRPIHVKKAPPLPGTAESGVPLRLAELGALPMGELVERLRHYRIDAHEGFDRSWLLVLLMRNAERLGVEIHGDGQLEVLPDGYGFLRSGRNSFLASPDDLYVARDMIRRHNLRPGQTIMGRVRTERRKEKYFALKDVRAVNGFTPEQAAAWTPFEELTPIFPNRRILLETRDARDFPARITDLVAPIGFGQRGLIVSPPRAGKTMMLKTIAHSVATNYPDVKLVVFLVDERPEEVTDMLRSVKGEVIFSTFDEPPQRHIQVADRVSERVRSLVESGFDVVLLLDSLTRLGRAYNAAARSSGRILSGGLEAKALQKPKRLFGSARNIDGGGSLTILASALIETNSRMDEVIFEEFKGTGNMEIVLSRAISEQRIFPAIDIHKSGTRMEDLLLDPAEAALVKRMRVALADLTPVDAIEKLLEKLRKTSSNAEFLLSLNTAVF